MTARTCSPDRPRPRARLGWTVRTGAAFGALLVGAGFVTGVPSLERLAVARAATGPNLGAGRGSFVWLVPAIPPANWVRVATPAGTAVLSYPPSFTPVTGDPGSISAAVRSNRGTFRAYLNVTPRQGREQLQGFAAFRVRFLGEDGDQAVRQEAAAEGLTFLGGQGSCVIDSYRTRIGHHRYREIACLVNGRHGGSVIVAAAASADWNRFQPRLRQAVASFTVS